MAKQVELVEIQPLDIRKTVIRVVGDTSLVTHAWSEKAKKQMLDKQMGATVTKAKDPKNPAEDFIRSMYWLTPMPEEMSEAGFADAVERGARFGFPVTAFKDAAISAAYRLGWTKDKMSSRGAFYIFGVTDALVEIHADTPTMREDMVKVGMGTADLRYRAEFCNWHADLVVSYNANGRLSIEQIINMLNAGGYTCGVGEWRPERDGQHGMFHVEAAG